MSGAAAMKSRVIRPAKILADAFQVVVPENIPGEIGAGREHPGGSAQGSEADARQSLEDLQALLAAQEKAHAEEVDRVVQKAAEKVKEIVDRFTGAINDMEAQREELLQSSEETLVRIAVAVARKIVGDAIAVDETIVLEAVRRALNQVADRESVVIRVNPDDLRIVRDQKAEWLQMIEGAHGLEVHEDERIRRGGCLVETESGNVEAQIEKQLQTLEKSLCERVK